MQQNPKELQAYLSTLSKKISAQSLSQSDLLEFSDISSDIIIEDESQKDDLRSSFSDSLSSIQLKLPESVGFIKTVQDLSSDSSTEKLASAVVDAKVQEPDQEIKSLHESMSSAIEEEIPEEYNYDSDSFEEIPEDLDIDKPEMLTHQSNPMSKQSETYAQHVKESLMERDTEVKPKSKEGEIHSYPLGGLSYPMMQVMDEFVSSHLNLLQEFLLERQKETKEMVLKPYRYTTAADYHEFIRKKRINC